MDHDGVDAVLFDLDGVITPTAEIHMRAWNRMFSEYFAKCGIDAYTDEDYFQYIDGRPRIEGIGAMLAARGLSLPTGDDDDTAEADTVNGLGARKNAVFLKLLAEGIEAYAGSLAYLDALDSAGIASCVVSSSKNAVTVLKAAGLGDRFKIVVDGLVAAAEGIPGKPAPDTYLRGAELLGVPAQRCVVIEDAVSGVQAGAAGGFARVVGVDRGAGKEILSEAGADLVVVDLSELISGLEGSR